MMALTCSSLGALPTRNNYQHLLRAMNLETGTDTKPADAPDQHHIGAVSCLHQKIPLTQCQKCFKNINVATMKAAATLNKNLHEKAMKVASV
jgi:hypothetical protein